MMPKYPDIEVRLVGNDGNAYAILGNVRRAMRKAKLPPEEIDAYLAEATSGDYDHLLSTTMEWVSVT
jgi:hypothetical protein